MTKPKHYAKRTIVGLDVIDLSEHWGLNPQEMNILKYLLRDKGQDYEDMLKIIDYAQREANFIKKRELNYLTNEEKKEAEAEKHLHGA